MTSQPVSTARLQCCRRSDGEEGLRPRGPRAMPVLRPLLRGTLVPSDRGTGSGEIRRGSNRMSSTISLTASMLIVGSLGLGAYQVGRSDWHVDVSAPHGDTRLPVEPIAAEFRPKVRLVADGVGEAKPQPFLAAPAVGTWTRLADAPDGRFRAGVAAVDGKLYVLSGIDWWRSYESTLIYDPAALSWEVGANIHTVRSGPATGVIDGKVYVAGGGSPGFGWPKLSSTEVYDPVTDSWSACADMPSPRGFLGALGGGSATDGKLYALGGETPAGGLSKANEAYDPATDSWEGRADIPEHRADHAVVAVHNEIYVLGGEDVDWQATDSVFIYSPRTDTWREGAPMPVSREGFMASVVNNRIYVIGGSVPAVHVYDLASDAWTTGPNLQTTEPGLFGAAIDGRIYAIGGILERAGVFEVLDTGFRDLAISPAGKNVSTWGGLKRL